MLSFELLNFGAGFFASTALTDYFFQSNFAGQVIVVILVVFSVLAWGVMFCKKADLSAMISQNADTSRKVAKSANLLEAAGVKSLSGPFAELLRDAVNAWNKAGMGVRETEADRIVRGRFVENALQRAMSAQIEKYESKMTLLGTIISGAPFLGLLGTAWGVMDCFGSMSGQTSVTLQNLAPGVAGALLTTVAGLVVAIPSVFGYNYLTSVERDMITSLENFASLVSDKIELESRAEAAAESVPQKPAEVQRPRPAIRETVVEKTQGGAPKVINFSLDDDDSSSPTLPRNFDE